jgi:hypothetical protein
MCEEVAGGRAVVTASYPSRRDGETSSAAPSASSGGGIRSAKQTKNMRVDHRRPHVGVTHQLLHRANVIPRLQKMRGKGMAQRVRRRHLGNPRGPYRK